MTQSLYYLLAGGACLLMLTQLIQRVPPVVVPFMFGAFWFAAPGLIGGQFGFAPYFEVNLGAERLALVRQWQSVYYISTACVTSVLLWRFQKLSFRAVLAAILVFWLVPDTIWRLMQLAIAIERWW